MRRQRLSFCRRGFDQEGKKVTAKIKKELSLLAVIIKNNVVFFVALTAALLTMFIIPPDEKYIGYFDFKTLACLFCTLAVVNALKSIGFFGYIAGKIIIRAGNLRIATLLLVYITFIGSMFIANDMALLTFLPLGYFVLDSSGKKKYMAYVFILQTIAANLGGMLTPFGNPQNLYLYSKFNIPDGEFISIMALPFAVSIALVTVCCLFFPGEHIAVTDSGKALPRGKTAFYLALFVLTVVMVFRLIPYYIILPVVFVAVLFSDRKSLLKVDWFLLMTFAAFFVFSGNMARIPAVSAFFSALLEKNTLLTSVLSCQVISNVPSAVLLSQFTGNYRDLLIGVNIGGTGTLIASLASLITFRMYVAHNKGGGGKYVLLYSAFSFAFLLILTVVSSIF